MTSQIVEDAHEVTVRLELEDGGSLRAPAWTGTVTAIAIEPGQTVRSGDLVVSLDDRPVVAVHTPRPFYRDLSPGVSGSDVRMLEDMLTALGYDVGNVDARFDSSTGHAVKSWRTELGDAGASTAFKADQVVWLSAEDVDLAVTTLAVGTPAPSQGSVIATLQKVPRRVILLSADGPVEEDVTVPIDLVFSTGYTLGPITTNDLSSFAVDLQQRLPEFGKEGDADAESGVVELSA